MRALGICATLLASCTGIEVDPPPPAEFEVRYIKLNEPQLGRTCGVIGEGARLDRVPPLVDKEPFLLFEVPAKDQLLLQAPDDRFVVALSSEERPNGYLGAFQFPPLTRTWRYENAKKTELSSSDYELLFSRLRHLSPYSCAEQIEETCSPDNALCSFGEPKTYPLPSGVTRARQIGPAALLKLDSGTKLIGRSGFDSIDVPPWIDVEKSPSGDFWLVDDFGCPWSGRSLGELEQLECPPVPLDAIDTSTREIYGIGSSAVATFVSRYESGKWVSILKAPLLLPPLDIRVTAPGRGLISGAEGVYLFIDDKINKVSPPALSIAIPRTLGGASLTTNALWFLSDRGGAPAEIWTFDPATPRTRQLSDAGLLEIDNEGNLAVYPNLRGCTLPHLAPKPVVTMLALDGGLVVINRVEAANEAVYIPFDFDAMNPRCPID